MEAIYAEGTPIASYLEGDGAFEPNQEIDTDSTSLVVNDEEPPSVFAPSHDTIIQRKRRRLPHLRIGGHRPRESLQRIHDQWSTAINSRLGHSENARFLEHFRYILVASQLLNEYLDQGAFPPSNAPEQIPGLDGATSESPFVHAATSPIGVIGIGVTAFLVASLLSWTRVAGLISRRRAALVITIYILLAAAGYIYCRRQWLKYIRKHAVHAATQLTASWQGFEVACTSAISLIQEVELVSKGYRLSTPLPPISRLEESAPARRCSRLRKTLHKAYTAIIPACDNAVTILKEHANEEDLERYYEIYDVNLDDLTEVAKDATNSPVELHDTTSLKSLRVLSFRAGVLRRVVLCHLMALHADGGKPDSKHWQRATDAMSALHESLSASANSISQVLQDMETLSIPASPVHKAVHTPTRERMRNQVRKISTLSTGIRGLQAKMQILREETSRSIEQASDDLTDLGPDLMVQYEAIGADLRDLMQAWEQGKASLQTNLSKQEHRISMASSGLRSPVSSLGGLTAVDEDGTPADALRALNGEAAGGLRADIKSHRSSMATTSSEDEVFEAVAMPKQRSLLTREERIIKMNEERDRQATLRAKRDANTSMLKELESVINLRPKKGAPDGQRITSI